MASGLTNDLRDLVAQRRVVVVVGSGVSIGATGNAPAASWTGLLKLGVARCRELDSTLDQPWEDRVLGDIASGRQDDLLSAAEKVSSLLGAPARPEFSRWLIRNDYHSVHELPPGDPAGGMGSTPFPGEASPCPHTPPRFRPAGWQSGWAHALNAKNSPAPAGPWDRGGLCPGRARTMSAYLTLVLRRPSSEPLPLVLARLRYFNFLREA